ncbi:MAG TPA: CHAT domain-containing protein [Longimicrobium sp.]|nr:CHAT domain-containing protein [Longimicrobium sp.]
MGLISTLATCGTARASDDPLTALADALEVTGVAPRLSVSTAFQPCTQAAPQGGTIVQARCAAAGPDQKARLSRLAAGFANRRDDPAAMHALAIVDLVADDSSGRALDRSITNLRQAAALADEPAAPLADLAAALIVRAEHTQVPRDLLEAYEIAAQAVRQDSGNLAALYNRALALDRFGLVDETAADWRAYLTADSTSGWADDARRRLHAALAIGPPAPPPADAPLSAYAAYAAADPQGARELGMDRLLAEWGEAVEAGDTARAAHRLRRAAALGDALEHRPGGDASLADMVRAIHAAVPNATALRTLARAHREYGAGIRLFDALDYAAAQPRFAAAAGLGASPVLQRWARVHLGIVRVMQGGAEEGQRLLAAQAAAGDTGRNAALVARARWALGRTLSQRERWEAGLRNAEASARLFARTGERENEGAVLSLASEKHFLLGEPDSGYAAMHAGLQRLRPYRASVRLHGVLAASADAMAADGLNRSAVRTMAEGVGVGTRTGDPFFAAEARLKRARHLATAGDPSGARTDVDAARGLVPRIHQPGARGWMAANLAEVQALLSLHADAVGATRRLDSAAAYYAGAQFTYRVLPVLVAAAEARLLAGDAAGALRRLEDAVRMLDRRREEIGLEPRRAAVFDAARAVVDRVVLLELAAGRTDAALRHMDRARASLAGTGRPLDGDVAVAAPLGETAIEYARIADTLLTWTVSSGGVHVSRTVLDTVRLARTIQEVETRLQRGATEVEVRPGLSLLYDWLVRPVEARLDTGTPLVVVADGEIAAVPFAALHDARRGRYLVEDRPIRFAVSLAEARRTQPGDRADGVLLVADPAHDAREHPLLERLAHARAEVDSIVPSYPGASLLEGPRASPSALRSALARAGVFHFAGHAVFDDQRPERSYLVLAPAAHPSGAGRITAAELARLDLSRMRLVVLSACRTVRSGTSRAGGFTGLSGALLAAGAGGAIGSTWEVDDRWTAALMTRFHRAYRQSHDGPRSLRAAQLALLHSEDPALRTPAAWAGFRYAGK